MLSGEEEALNPNVAGGLENSESIYRLMFCLLLEQAKSSTIAWHYNL